MSDTTTDSTSETQTTETSSTDTGTDDTKDWKAEAEKWQTHARKQEEGAKANAAAAKELEQLRQQSMSDQEKAVAQAKAEGRREATAEVGGKLALAELRVAAAGRLSDVQLATLVDGLNLAAFIGEDGEVDQAKVAKFVDGIAPAAEEEKPAGFPDLGQGARGGTPPLGSDPLLRSLKSALDIR
jgi:hypothetical protein